MDNVPIILSVVAVVSNVLTYLSTRSKYKSEIKVNSMQAALDAVEIWQETGKKLQRDVKILSQEVAKEREERLQWQKTAKRLQGNVEELTKAVRLLKLENARLRRFLEKAGIKIEENEEG